MNVLVAADSFKDALAAPAVCAAIATGLRQRSPTVQVEEFPLADGGEGTLDVLAKALSLRLLDVDSVDPLARPLRAPIGISGDGQIAAIEAAHVCGLGLLKPNERNPLRTSTLGLGWLIAEAQRRGVSRCLLAIGGTATNDGGIGLAHVLGWRFLDENGNALPQSGAGLAQITRIVPPDSPLSGIAIEVLCDVSNPLFGLTGAAHVYARQKGARDADIELLDTGLRRLAECAAKLKLECDPHTPGAGAAGGLGFGAAAFLNARLVPGIETLLDLTRFDESLARADVIVTGEGRLDVQTLHGKLIHGIAMRAKRRGVPVIALCGEVAAPPEQLRSLGVRAYCIDESSASLAQKIAATAQRLTQTAARMPLL